MYQATNRCSWSKVFDDLLFWYW